MSREYGGKARQRRARPILYIGPVQVFFELLADVSPTVVFVQYKYIYRVLKYGRDDTIEMGNMGYPGWTKCAILVRSRTFAVLPPG